MPWVTWVPPQQPSQSGTSLTTTPRLLTNTFGDGYIQTTPDGANFLLGDLSMGWNSIRVTDWAAIAAFLQAHVSVPFLYQLPDEVTPRQFRAVKWQKGYGTSYWLANCSADLAVDFSPG